MASGPTRVRQTRPPGGRTMKNFRILVSAGLHFCSRDDLFGLSAVDSPPANSGSQTGSQRGSQRRQTPSDAGRRPATIVQVRWLIRRPPATPRDGKNAPEKRKVDSSILSLTTTDRHGQQPAASAFRLFKGRFRLYFSTSAGVCRGMPPCPWDVCGGASGRGLVGFLWGSPGLRLAP